MPGKRSYGNFRKDTEIGRFLRFCKGGTKGKFSKIAQKVGRLSGLEKNPEQAALSPNYYALKEQRSQDILTQKAAPKVPGKPNYDNCRKDT